MKKLLLLMAFVFMMIITSCSKDDDKFEYNPNTDSTLTWIKSNIIGTWTAYSYYATNHWVEGNFKDNSFTFNSNGTVVIDNFVNKNGTWTYSVYGEDWLVYVTIDDSKYWVLSLREDEKEITLTDFAKLRKID